MQARLIPFPALGGVFEQDDVAAASAVMQNASLPGGSFFPVAEETAFQKAFAQHEGAAFAIAVNSCGTALDLCMMVLGVGPCDEVITTPLTFVASATCAAARGARVVFADIDPVTLCLNPGAVRKKITARTKAIIPVHFAGLAADIDAFDQISRETGVPVIYDAAHAVGTRYKGSRVGGRGKANCYSFQSNKNITTLGEGGAVTTDDPDFAELVRQKKTFGYVYGPTLRVVTIGFNYRLTQPQLAVGLTQTAKAGRVIAQKLSAMKRLHTLLGDVDEITLPVGIEEGHGAHLYVIRVNSLNAGFSREMLQSKLKAHGVGTAVHYPAVWSWEAFANIDHDRTDCPVAERACAEVLSLPVHPLSTDLDLKYTAWAVKQSIRELKREL